MLSIKPIGGSNGEVSYYATLGTEDYYTKGGEPLGAWWGRGTEVLKVSGHVLPDDFRNLLRGRSVDGKKSLVQNAMKRERRSAFDLTFTVPKSVSVAWSQGDLDFRRSIEKAGERALSKALDTVQELCGVTRRGRHGERLEEAGLIGAIFRHDTARAVKGELPDPNLHWHAVILNLSAREDGTTGALDARALFRPHMKMALGALFRAELSKELLELGLTGYRPVRNGKAVTWFELEGVPQELIDEFSKRRHVIEDWLKARGLSGAKASELATNVTKLGKEAIHRDELLSSWQEVGRVYGFSADALLGLANAREAKLAVADIEDIAEQITQSESHFSETALIRRVAESVQGLGIGIDEIRTRIEDTLTQSNEIVLLQEVKGERRITTERVLATERRLVEAIHRAQEQAHGVEQRVVSEALSRFTTLREEQRQAVCHITSGRARIACVNGMAGTGKTFMLQVARTAWDSCGMKVIGTSLAAKASQTLEAESGIRSHHIQSLLYRLESGRESLDAKTVLVLDEAGMVGTVMLERLVSLTEQAGAKLVCVGDYRQLQAIDAGGPFRFLCEELGAATLEEITRQRDDWARAAVKDIAYGKASQALHEYQTRGLLVVSESRDDAMKALVDSWSDSGLVKDSLIFAGTRLDVSALNQLCQASRKAALQLGEDSVDVGRERIFVGDRVMFTKNNAGLLVRNGNTGTLIGISECRQVVRVGLDTGYVVSIDLNSFDNLTLAYACTVHKAQGQTVEQAFVLAGGDMTDRELAYVQASRSRGETRIFCDAVSAGAGLDDLSRKMERSRTKDLALEYLIEAA